jgi:alpha-amylase
MRQYTPEGTFNAFASHLPRLKEMGVEILWLMPVHPIGSKKRKGSMGSYYSIRDFKDVNPEYGNKTDFKNLINEAHKSGMKVILDWVANHAAWDNVWTVSNPDFFEQDEQGNFKSPYDWEDVIQINHNNPAEQQAMIDAMKYWVTDFDIDGFRADLAHLTPLPFWINARTQITPLKKELTWLAETEDIPYHDAFDISFTWKWMHITEDYCKGKEDFSALLRILEEYATTFPENALRMFFTSNHDENSWCGTEYEKYGSRAQALAVFSFTWGGVPLIYSGQELPVRKRLAFFEKDTIEWTDEIALHSFYKTLLQFRKNNEALFLNKSAAPLYLNGEMGKNVLAFCKKSGESTALVLINMHDNAVDYHFSTEGLEGSYTNIFSGEVIVIEGEASFTMEAGGYVVLERNNKM